MQSKDISLGGMCDRLHSILPKRLRDLGRWMCNKIFVFEPVLLLGLHFGSFGYGKRICKHKFMRVQAKSTIISNKMNLQT